MSEIDDEGTLALARAARWEWADGRTRAGAGCYTLLGHAPGDFPDTSAAWLALCHPEDRLAQMTWLTGELMGADQAEVELRLRAASGRWVWFLLRCRVLERGDGGVPLRVRGVVIDIDERKRRDSVQSRTLELLALRGASHRIIVRSGSAPQLVDGLCNLLVGQGGFDRAVGFLFHAEQRAFVPQPAVVARRGRRRTMPGIDAGPPPSASEHRLVDLVARESKRQLKLDADGYPRAVALPLRQGDRVSGVLILAAAEGEICEADLLLMLDEIAEDVSLALAGFAREERRVAAELAWRESETRLHVALSATGQGTYDLDLRTGATVVSAEYATMLGHDADSFSESMESFVDRVHPDDRAETLRRLQGYLAGDLPDYRVEFRLRSAEGGWRWILSIGKIVERDWRGRPVRMVGTHTDVTERRRAEDMRAHLEQQLRQVQKMEAIGRLAGGIVHDFNNLLSVVLSCSKMVLDELAESDPLREDVVQIHTAGERAARLTRQLLAFTRQQVVAPKLLDVNHIVVGIERMLRRLLGEDIAFETRLVPGAATVRADAGQLEQVLMNLAVNAREAMPRGGKLLISTSLATVTADDPAAKGVPPGKYVALAVADDGIGMDAETQARLFEPYFTTKEKGTGLGLAVVFGIVRQNDGWVRLDSAPGRGSTFRIYLPVVSGRPATITQPPLLPDAQGTETILLVEDEDALRGVARTILVRQGYTVLTARAPSEALALVAAHRGTIHLLLTDVLMPQMNGVELAQRVLAARPGIKVLCMSGYAGDAMVRDGVIGAGLPFLQKPITPELLARRVREVLA